MQLLPRRFSLATTFAVALLILLSVGGDAVAQRKKPASKSEVGTNQPPAAAPQRLPETPLAPLPADPSVETADIAITARVQAESLKFDVVPNPTVEFPGQPARTTVWEAERENLPTPVEPGVTYRNIGIRLKITSVFTDIDRIVAEALGEVPVTPDTVQVPPDSKTIEHPKTVTSPATSATPTTAPARSLPNSVTPPQRERP